MQAKPWHSCNQGGFGDRLCGSHGDDWVDPVASSLRVQCEWSHSGFGQCYGTYGNFQTTISLAVGEGKHMEKRWHIPPERWNDSGRCGTAGRNAYDGTIGIGTVQYLSLCQRGRLVWWWGACHATDGVSGLAVNVALGDNAYLTDRCWILGRIKMQPEMHCSAIRNIKSRKNMPCIVYPFHHHHAAHWEDSIVYCKQHWYLPGLARPFKSN